MVHIYETDDRRIGRLLKVRRGALGLTQADIGAAAGVTAQQVQKYESGINSIVPNRLSRIAKALDVPVSFFFPDDREAGTVPRVATGSPLDILGQAQSVELLTTFDGVQDREVRTLFLKLLQRVEELLRSETTRRVDVTPPQAATHPSQQS